MKVHFNFSKKGEKFNKKYTLYAGIPRFHLGLKACVSVFDKGFLYILFV